MAHEELKVIMDLMKDLQEKMEYGEDDFSERLGRKKPGVEVVKIEGELPMEEEDMEGAEEMAMLDEEPDMGGDDFEMEESPEDKLKNRLMKLRG